MFRNSQSLKHLPAVLLLSLFLQNVTPAHALDAATGNVILTVSGRISETNNDDVAEFDLDLLDHIKTVTFETSTIWTEGVQTFTGVELAALLEVLGVESGQLRATAVNDYAVDIPVSDAVVDGPIIAFMRNGETMSLRDKGPLWIVYPYDQSVQYQSELIYSRSIWQLDRIEVIP